MCTLSYDIKISRAVATDAEEILALQRDAYLTEAERYGDYDIPPLKETIDELKARFSDHIFINAISEGRIVGTVRAYEKEGTCHVGRLAVHPSSRGRGIGTALMQAVESRFSSCRFELFTGAQSRDNIRLYEKLGYKVYKTSRHGCGNVEAVYMEKRQCG